MTQNPATTPAARPTYRAAPAASGDDLDALLDSIMGEDPGPRQERSDVALREVARQRIEQQRLAEQRARQTERVTDDLRGQIRAIALQVQKLSEATANQAEQGRAIQELRQAMRDIVVATHKPAQPALPSFNAELQLPSLQIKLVLAQAAHLLYQAGKDVAVLGNWSMLFAGISLGTLLPVALAFAEPDAIRFWVYLAIAIFAALVSLVFGALTYQARRRAANARRAMDDTTLTRTIPVGGQ